MPSLYSNSGAGVTGQSLYGGQTNTVAQPLSQRNQDTAQQLGLPGHEGAGSQQAAQSDWANFEDIFNKNQGYNQRERDAAQAQVAYAGLKPGAGFQQGLAADKAGAQNAKGLQMGAAAIRAKSAAGAAAGQSETQTGRSEGKAPAANQSEAQTGVSAGKAPPVNPAAPPQLQGGSLQEIQRKSELLSGYGQPAPEQDQGSATAGETGVGAAPIDPAQNQKRAPAPPPVSGAQVGGNLLNPQVPSPVDAGNQPAPADQQPAPAPAAVPKTAKGQPTGPGPAQSVFAAANQPLGMTQDETAQLNQLQKQNELLKGWGEDNGLDVLQQAYGPEASQYDADMMSASGGKQLQQDLSKQYGAKQTQAKAQVAQNMQNRAASKMQAQQLLAQAQNQSDPQQAAAMQAGAQDQANAADAPTDYSQGDMADDHALMNNVLFGNNDENPWSNMHAMGMTLNPADWATIGMGEAGVDVPVTTEMFSKNFDMSGGEIQKTWPQGRFIMAFNELVNKGVSPESRHAFLNFLKANPDVLKEYLNMKNPGYMARNMRQWMSVWDQQHAESNTLNSIAEANRKAGAVQG